MPPHLEGYSLADHCFLRKSTTRTKDVTSSQIAVHNLLGLQMFHALTFTTRVHVTQNSKLSSHSYSKHPCYCVQHRKVINYKIGNVLIYLIQQVYFGTTDVV